MNQTKPKTETKIKLPRSPFPSWCSFLLLHPFRKRSFDRDKITSQAGIKTGQTVVELGCGPGFFTEIIAQKVGLGGKVIAQDVVPKMLAKLKKRMRRFPITENIEPLLASSSSTGLDAESVDIVFAANVFEEITKENEMAGTADEIFRLLKPGGTLYFGEHHIPPQMLKNILLELERAGFTQSEFDINYFHHSAIFKK